MFSVRPALGLAVLLTGAGCAGPRAALQVTRLDRTGVEALRLDARLRSGDRFALTISVDVPLYVRVLRRLPSGALQPVLPAAGAEPVQLRPGVTTKLPASNEWFRLDDRTGDEAVLVIASRTPLAEAAALRLSPAARSAAPAARRTGDREPQESNSRNRDFDSARRILYGALDREGVTVLHFPFSHE